MELNQSITSDINKKVYNLYADSALSLQAGAEFKLKFSSRFVLSRCARHSDCENPFADIFLVGFFN